MQIENILDSNNNSTKIGERNITNLCCADDTTLITRNAKDL